MATATATTMMTEEELATRPTAQRIAFKGKVRSRARKRLDRNEFAHRRDPSETCRPEKEGARGCLAFPAFRRRTEAV